MHFLALFLFSLLFLLAIPSSSIPVSASSSLNRFPHRELRCAVCEVLVDEMDSAIAETDKKNAHTVQTRWRVDEKRRIPYSRTEFRLMEILEEELEHQFQSYGIFNSTELGRLRLIRKPSPPEGKYGKFAGFYASKQLLKGIKSIYKELRENHLEDIMLLFHRQEERVKEKLCVDKMGVCAVEWTFESVTIAPEFIEMEPPKKKEEEETKKEENTTGENNNNENQEQNVNQNGEQQQQQAQGETPSAEKGEL